MQRTPAPSRSAPACEPAFNADETLEFIDPPRRRLLIRAVAVAALSIYAAYLGYRGLFTINRDALTFSLLVYFAEVHGFFSLFLYFHQVWTLRRRRVTSVPDGLVVDVFVTTFNEPEDLLRQTLRAAVAMRYPHRTFVLDDGRRAGVKALAEELGCRYITRATNEHAKAGNWNNAFAQTDADFIATFDADHVPRPEFLERTLGFFRDPKVALVQVPQEYHNLDSVQHRVSWKQRRLYGEQDAFFNLVMPGKDNWNASFFCGTGAVLRRKALEPHGGILTGTITEDLHTSVVLHSEGWKSVYLNEVLVTGLAPIDLHSFEVQRLRWAEGNLRVASFVNPLTAPGLSIAQRISYLASLYHWTIGVPKVIYYLAPPLMLFTSTFPIANFDRTFVLVYLCFLSSLIVSYTVVSRGRGRLLMDELFNMMSFFTLLRAVKRVLIGRGRAAKFEVTRKKGPGGPSIGPVLPHLLLLAFSVLGLTWSALGIGFGITDDVAGAGTAMFWTFYNMALMIAVIRIGTRPVEKRDGGRFRAGFAVEQPDARFGTGPVGVTRDISVGGCSLLWPRPLTVGSQIPLRVHFGPRSVDWTGEIASDLGAQSDGWRRYGVRFIGLSQADVDLIHDSIFSLVVPEIFTTLTEPAWVVRRWRQVQQWIGRHRIRADRHLVSVPLRIHVPASGDTFVVAAREASATGMSALVPRPVPIGTRVDLSLLWPEREWHGSVTVARCEPRRSRTGFDTWLLGLRFAESDAPVDAIFQTQRDAA